jgi:hypothetical protein
MMRFAVRSIMGLALFCLAAMAMAQVAVVQSVRGDVQAQADGGAPAPLAQGQAIAAGTQLLTGENGQAVVRFTDGHLLALKDNSTVRIAAYVYDRQQPSASSMVMELLRGGLRSVTGLLGKANPQAFRLNTPVATIGIRGSDWMAALQDNSLYTGVNSGGIAVNNAANSLLVDAGQYSATLGSSATNLIPLSQLPAGIFGSLPTLSLPAVASGAGGVTTGAVGGIAPGTLAIGAGLAAAAAALSSSSDTSGTSGTTGTTGTTGTR